MTAILKIKQKLPPDSGREHAGLRVEQGVRDAHEHRQVKGSYNVADTYRVKLNSSHEDQLRVPRKYVLEDKRDTVKLQKIQCKEWVQKRFADFYEQNPGITAKKARSLLNEMYNQVRDVKQAEMKADAQARRELANEIKTNDDWQKGPGGKRDKRNKALQTEYDLVAVFSFDERETRTAQQIAAAHFANHHKQRSSLNGSHGEYTNDDDLITSHEVNLVDEVYELAYEHEQAVNRLPLLIVDNMQPQPFITPGRVYAVMDYLDFYSLCIANPSNYYAFTISEPEFVNDDLDIMITLFVNNEDIDVPRHSPRIRSQLNGVNGEATNSDDVRRTKGIVRKAVPSSSNPDQPIYDPVVSAPPPVTVMADYEAAKPRPLTFRDVVVKPAEAAPVLPLMSDHSIQYFSKPQPEPVAVAPAPKQPDQAAHKPKAAAGKEKARKAARQNKASNLVQASVLKSVSELAGARDAAVQKAQEAKQVEMFNFPLKHAQATFETPLCTTVDPKICNVVFEIAKEYDFAVRYWLEPFHADVVPEVFNVTISLRTSEPDGEGEHYYVGANEGYHNWTYGHTIVDKTVHVCRKSVFGLTSMSRAMSYAYVMTAGRTADRPGMNIICTALRAWIRENVGDEFQSHSNSEFRSILHGTWQMVKETGEYIAHEIVAPDKVTRSANNTTLADMDKVTFCDRLAVAVNEVTATNDGTKLLNKHHALPPVLAQAYEPVREAFDAAVDEVVEATAMAAIVGAPPVVNAFDKASTACISTLEGIVNPQPEVVVVVEQPNNAPHDVGPEPMDVTDKLADKLKDYLGAIRRKIVDLIADEPYGVAKPRPRGHMQMANMQGVQYLYYDECMSMLKPKPIDDNAHIRRTTVSDDCQQKCFGVSYGFEVPNARCVRKCGCNEWAAINGRVTLPQTEKDPELPHLLDTLVLILPTVNITAKGVMSLIEAYVTQKGNMYAEALADPRPGHGKTTATIKEEVMLTDTFEKPQYCPRLIQGRAPRGAIQKLPWYSAYGEYIKGVWHKNSSLFYASGSSPKDKGDWYGEQANKGRRFYCFDAERFDCTLNYDLLDEQIDCYERFGMPQRLADFLRTDIPTNGRTKSFEYSTAAGRRSGEGDTSFGNSTIMMNCLNAAMRRLGYETGQYAIMLDGDDSVIAVDFDKPLDVAHFMSEVKRTGIKLTFASDTADLTDFCSKCFVPTVQGYYCVPIFSRMFKAFVMKVQNGKIPTRDQWFEHCKAVAQGLYETARWHPLTAALLEAFGCDPVPLDQDSVRWVCARYGFSTIDFERVCTQLSTLTFTREQLVEWQQIDGVTPRDILPFASVMADFSELCKYNDPIMAEELYKRKGALQLESFIRHENALYQRAGADPMDRSIVGYLHRWWASLPLQEAYDLHTTYNTDMVPLLRAALVDIIGEVGDDLVGELDPLIPGGLPAQEEIGGLGRLIDLLPGAAGLIGAIGSIGAGLIRGPSDDGGVLKGPSAPSRSRWGFDDPAMPPQQPAPKLPDPTFDDFTPLNPTQSAAISYVGGLLGGSKGKKHVAKHPKHEKRKSVAKQKHKVPMRPKQRMESGGASGVPRNTLFDGSTRRAPHADSTPASALAQLQPFQAYRLGVMPGIPAGAQQGPFYGLWSMTKGQISEVAHGAAYGCAIVIEPNPFYLFRAAASMDANGIPLSLATQVADTNADNIVANFHQVMCCYIGVRIRNLTAVAAQAGEFLAGRALKSDVGVIASNTYAARRSSSTMVAKGNADPGSMLEMTWQGFADINSEDDSDFVDYQWTLATSVATDESASVISLSSFSPTPQAYEYQIVAYWAGRVAQKSSMFLTPVRRDVNFPRFNNLLDRAMSGFPLYSPDRHLIRDDVTDLVTLNDMALTVGRRGMTKMTIPGAGGSNYRAPAESKESRLLRALSQIEEDDWKDLLDLDVDYFAAKSSILARLHPKRTFTDEQILAIRDMIESGGYEQLAPATPVSSVQLITNRRK